MICQRCSRDIYKFSQCDYCSRKICSDCIKSSKRKSKVIRLVICKDCWSSIPKRKLYKAVGAAVQQQEQYQQYQQYRR